MTAKANAPFGPLGFCRGGGCFIIYFTIVNGTAHLFMSLFALPLSTNLQVKFLVNVTVRPLDIAFLILSRKVTVYKNSFKIRVVDGLTPISSVSLLSLGEVQARCGSVCLLSHRGRGVGGLRM